MHCIGDERTAHTSRIVCDVHVQYGRLVVTLWSHNSRIAITHTR